MLQRHAFERPASTRTQLRTSGLLGLPPVLLPMSPAPKGTQCDFGGIGATKRKGCTLPRKKAALASRSEVVLEALSQDWLTDQCRRCRSN